MEKDSFDWGLGGSREMMQSDIFDSGSRGFNGKDAK